MKNTTSKAHGMINMLLICIKGYAAVGNGKHVISVLYNKADHGECVHELHTYVHKVYWLQTWKTTYVYKVEPIKGRALWPRSECPMQITPPPHRNQPGKPKRKRRQSMEEKSESKSQRSDVVSVETKRTTPGHAKVREGLDGLCWFYLLV
uniref:Uncharacterized protein n=1 Tax=Lactuca sativa TaxID=4236 RepID=A0A9R1V082_LACSA|nr:hypothetical protein LSAT_V11C700359530 [Lactuca sativa]